jgi:hypothetical protein
MRWIVVRLAAQVGLSIGCGLGVEANAGHILVIRQV